MLSGKVTYQFNPKNTLVLQMGLPIFGVVFRPDFEINGKTLTKTTVIGRSGLFYGKLAYEYKLSQKLCLIATYSLNCFHFDKPRPVAILQNDLVIGVKKTF